MYSKLWSEKYIEKFDSDNYDKGHFISDEMGEDVNGGKYESK